MKITICGIAELGQHCAAGVTHVLSILDPGWPDPEAFGDFPAHRRVAVRFHDVIAATPGATVPTAADVATVLTYGREVMAAGRDTHLLIHCHAGVSRSTASAALLLAQADPARPVEAIFAEIGRLRPRAWPNLLLLEHGETALGRHGEIVPAVAAQYRRVLTADPQFGAFIVDTGRGREVELAGLVEGGP
ncbi:MAG TPA: protein-tyrosine-phosphatase [Stellaceae bacterium]|nr:protein-tyrosine-phosphatase [Stellaceae bacterium]